MISRLVGSKTYLNNYIIIIKVSIRTGIDRFDLTNISYYITIFKPFLHISLIVILLMERD